MPQIIIFRLISSLGLLVLLAGMTSIVYAAGVVKPLNLYLIQGKPGIQVELSSLVKGSPPLERLLRLRILGKDPERLLASKRFTARTSAEGDTLCILAADNLNENVLAEVLVKRRSSNTACAIKRYDRTYSYSWKGGNPLEQEDSQALFKKKYLPEIIKAARKTARLDKLGQIAVARYTSIDPRRYSREKQSFRVVFTPGLSYPLPSLVVENNKSIRGWKVAPDKARQLMKTTFKKPGGRYLRLIEVVKLGDIDWKGKYPRVRGQLVVVELYANDDKALKNPLHRFARADFTDMAAVERQRKTAQIAKMPRLQMAEASYFLAAYAKLSGKGLKLADELVAGRRYSSSDPFKKKREQEADRTRFQKTLNAALKSFDLAKSVWVKGQIKVRPYNIDRGFYPVEKIEISLPKGPDASLVWVQAVAEQLQTLPVPIKLAEGLGAVSGFPFRARVRPVVSSEDTDRQGIVRYHSVKIAVEKLELLKDAKYSDIKYDENKLWAYRPPGYASIQQQAVKVDALEALKEECRRAGSSSCYRKLCDKIKPRGKRDEYKACRKAYAAALLQERKEESRRQEAAAAKKPKPVETTSMASCRRKYEGSNLQPWMPVRGTPEYDKALAQCARQPVRTPYGSDVLGMRLGMDYNDVGRFIRRQGFRHGVTLRDTRPFEKAELFVSEDRNTGLATFYIRNGEVERLAAISRRLYFKDNEMKAGKIKKGLRKKYGKESWSRGNREMLWLEGSGNGKPSAKSCSGLVDMITERTGWNRQWKAVKNSRTQGEIGLSSTKMKCISRFGMPNPAGGQPGTDVGKQMLELQRCMQEGMSDGNDTSSSRKGKNTGRNPFMVKAVGMPATYKKYASCGPVIISRFENKDNGSLDNFSLVLFDPGWISRQPDFAFQGEDEDGQVAY